MILGRGGLARPTGTHGGSYREPSDLVKTAIVAVSKYRH